MNSLSQNPGMAQKNRTHLPNTLEKPRSLGKIADLFDEDASSIHKSMQKNTFMRKNIHRKVLSLAIGLCNQ